MINCPNPSCNHLNPESDEVCQVCQSALPHHYLWGVGRSLSGLKPGELYQNRYLLKRDHIFLDTQPGHIPESLEELPAFLAPYMHLSAYPVHTPKPYAIMRTSEDDYVLMLESSALSIPPVQASSTSDKSVQPALLPKLSARWTDAPPLRQLNWLWQIAQLWDAFTAEQVGSTLLDDRFVRVDGSIVRLLELSSLPVAPTNVRAQLQPTSQPAVTALGKHWQPLADSAHQSVRAFLNSLCEKLETQQLNAEQLVDRLGSAISECALGQTVGYEMAVYTDQGPTRKRNEDACYPQSGTDLALSSEQTQQSPQLLIVCDGIGGHQGGDVASKLAIATIESRLSPLLSAESPSLTHTELTIAIEDAICAANDEISAQNDKAQRQARDRMGTTLVLALVKGADVYIAHLGDSRAYRIGYRNCQQVTLDDDVASRQVRLGGSLYREVLAQPGSGSLIQALGMSSSQMLRPTVQRFVLDENCVFLLCSDGLSDSDRVEQFWQSVIRPLVVAEGSVAAVGQQLINLANKYNGHDNVTVGLLRAQVIRTSERMLPKELNEQATAEGRIQRGAARGNTRIVPRPSEQSAKPAVTYQPKETVRASNQALNEIDARANTKKIKSRSSDLTAKQIGLFLGLLAIVGSALYFLFPGLSLRIRSEPNTEEVSSAASSENAIEDIAVPTADISVGQYLRIRQTNLPPASLSPGRENTESRNTESRNTESRNTGNDADSAQLELYPNPTVGPNDIPGAIPTGSIVRVIGERATAQTGTDQAEGSQGKWIQVKLCSIPSGESISDAPSETDEATSQSENTPSSVGQLNNAPMILSPDAEGWAIASQMAAVADNVQNLEPTQRGQCES